MKTWLTIIWFEGCWVAQAHIGSPNVFVEGNAGPYPVRVVVRPPTVVPGLAEITVRVEAGSVHQVTVFPVFSKAGRAGAPRPDVARLMRGETNVYSAALWLMKPGAYSVEVTTEGDRGNGTLVVPVNSVATNTRPMARGLRGLLLALGLVLVLGALKIAAAVFGESRLAPGALPSRRDRWRARLAVGLTAGVLMLLLFGGKKWWDFEDANYRNNSLYRPRPMTALVRVEQNEPILTLEVDASSRRGQWTPLLPDHGKWMHLFLIRDQDPVAFAHLHPIPRSRTKFEAPVPPLPGGLYHLYADVTHEDGFAETLTTTVELPSASLASQRLWLGTATEAICSAEVAERLARDLPFPPDPDDSWQLNASVSAFVPTGGSLPVAGAGGGYKLVWENPEVAVQNLDTSLRFKLLDPDNHAAPVEPYMGMAGHAVVRRQDGAVFAHIHPMGTISMAAQEFFVTDTTGIRTAAEEKMPALNLLPVNTASHGGHTNQLGGTAEISFPYAFPQAGSYRLWVQTKCRGRILTAVFDTTVKAAK